MFPSRVLPSLAAVAAALLLATLLPGAFGAALAGTATRSNDGPVVFQLTPRGVEDGRFHIDLRVDTHSGDLADLDLQAATVLRAGSSAFRPLEPVPLRGHHARGTLVFALNAQPQAFEVVISGPGRLGELVFRWP